MTLIAVSQRIAVEPRYGERRDCLDQMWTRFLAACGFVPVPVPNVPEMVGSLLAAAPITGILLTGGNDLTACGGDVPERDATEGELLRIADERGFPLLGVCRGMQFIQHHFGTPLRSVTGHVARRHTVVFEGLPIEVNSYHHFGATETLAPLECRAAAPDGVIEAVRHIEKRIAGIMWHPERVAPFAQCDVAYFRTFFGGTAN